MAQRKYRLLSVGQPTGWLPVLLALILFLGTANQAMAASPPEETTPATENIQLSATEPTETVTEATEHTPSAPIMPEQETVPPNLPLSEDPEALVEWFSYNLGFSGKPLETEPAEADQIKVACIGDSITYGYGIFDWTQNNYPMILQDLLGEDYHVQNFGVNGGCVQSDTDHPYNNYNIFSDTKSYGADIVVFMMGSNDSKPENWHGEEAFKTALYELLSNYGNSRIVLCTPAACFPTEVHSTIGYDLQSGIISEIARIIREVAAERNYPLVDIHALTLENPQWFDIDGVHPNNDGAAAIASAVYEAVSQINIVE